jgi:RHS repeat-associated protein
MAYALFGETYASSGSTDPAFTGQRQDTVSGLYDFPAREYSIQGRWPSPDPAGLAAVDPTNPQSWNRYAYVVNNPLMLIDPTGLDCQWIWGDSGVTVICDPLGGGGGGSGGGGGGGGSGPGRGCTVQAVPDPYTELVVAGYGLPEDFMEMDPASQTCGGGGASNTGGGGNSSVGFFHKLGGTLVCASQTANQLSIAGVVGVNGENNPILNAFLGNTFSGVVDTGSHVYSAFTAPDKPQAAALVLADVTLGGVRQGIISGGGPLSKGLVGAVTDTVVNALAKASTPAGLTSLATTAETVGAQTLAKSIGAAKVGVDAAIFFGSFVSCVVRH